MRKLVNVLTATHPLIVGVLLLGALASLLALFLLIALVALIIPILAAWFWCGVAYLGIRAAYRKLLLLQPDQEFELHPAESSQAPVPQNEEAAPLPTMEPEWRVVLDEHGHGEFLIPLDEETVPGKEARNANSRN
jgi:hypothetical protein